MTHNTSLEARIIARAANDATFKQDLLHNPKTTIEKAFEVKFPATAIVQVQQDSNGTLHVVLPAPESSLVELDDAQLSQVTGGSGNAGQIGGGDIFEPRV